MNYIVYPCQGCGKGVVIEIGSSVCPSQVFCDGCQDVDNVDTVVKHDLLEEDIEYYKNEIQQAEARLEVLNRLPQP